VAEAVEHLQSLKMSQRISHPRMVIMALSFNEASESHKIYT
jgi:hypothetical protein